MTKIYLAPYLAQEQELHLVASYFNRTDLGSTLFWSKPEDFSYTSFIIVKNIQEADYVLIPHGLKKVDYRIKKYLDSVRFLSKKYNKKIIVFIGGDLSHNIFIDDMIVMKGSQYLHLKRPNEIIVPPFVEDLGGKMGVVPREKSDKPVVGFCGWSDLSGYKSYIKYRIKNFYIDMVKIILPQSYLEVFKKGIFFRKRAINIINKSPLVYSNIIVRESFSGNLKTISKSADQLRKEYIFNIIESDFVLTPKGDGNFSLRFYETLSLGRIPVLIDTDCVLPLEKYLNYQNAIIRISYRNIDDLDSIISNIYHRMSEYDLITMQKNARNLFLSSLRYDSFFNLVFSKPLEYWLD